MPQAPAERRTDRAQKLVHASREELYAAFAHPDALMAWLPPGNMSGQAPEYEFREGGRFRIELTYGHDAPDAAGKTSERTDVTRGRFVALEPGVRIVQAVQFESGDALFAGEMLMTWTFEPTAEGTTVTITAENVPPGISQADHDEGLRSSLENLARYVETDSPVP